MADGKTNTLTPRDFEKLLDDELSERTRNKIEEYELTYRELSEKERDACLIAVIDRLFSQDADASGQHRLGVWEKGWSENLDALISTPGDKDALTPRYFGKTDKKNIIRLNSNFVAADTDGFERKILAVILEWLFEKYMKDADSIYEFGCGTGHHLLQVREVNKSAKLYGLDWAEASQKIIAKMVEGGMLENAEGKRFDFFNPDYKLKLDKDSVVYTVAALEQVGENYKDFLDYLIGNKPKIVVHVEPIQELLDENNLLDYLSIAYAKKRNYLWGFLDYLKKNGVSVFWRVHIIWRNNRMAVFASGERLKKWKASFCVLWRFLIE